MSEIVLKGMTWGHSRGITPLLAFSQRFSELNPQVKIIWEKRTLQAFADFPIEELAKDYDLLIIDHPWVGCAAATECVLPLDLYLSLGYLKNQADNSVGNSHLSYNYNLHQWALAIDAATPVASFRKDLLEENNTLIPQTWEDLIELAKKGKVAVPAIPIDLLMNFYMFCIAHGNEPFKNKSKVIDEATGIKALETMLELYSLVDKKMFELNPIAVAELMTNTNDYWYCAFAYGYSNYSRKGYARYLLSYTDLIAFDNKRLRSTIGGTGLAVSAYCYNTDVAIKFVEMIVSEEIQSTVYVENGGQPGHLTAWKSETANMLTNNFFTNTLPTLERGFTRPRYNGYLGFQDEAGEPIQHYLMHGSNPKTVLDELNKMYKNSLEKV